MKVRLTFRRADADSGNDLLPGPRPVALGLSVAIHAAVIGWAMLSSVSLPLPKNSPTVYKEFIEPEEKKIVWYRVQELPKIAPERQIGNKPKPQAKEKLDKVLISTTPDADPGKQLIFRPDVTKRIQKDIPVPDLIAVETPKEIARPQKVFRPPSPAPAPQPAKITTVEPAPPDILKGTPSTAAAKLEALQVAQTRIAKAFVPPTKVPARIDPAPQIVASAEPAVLQGPQDQNNAALDVLRGSNKLPARPFVAPAGASKSPSNKPGTGVVAAPPSLMAGDVNAAILSTAAVDKLVTAIPEGSRPVQMSGAPTVGPTASGAASGLKIPGVAVQPAIREEKQIGIPDLTGRVVYEETRVSSSLSTLSAPLRPSSRMIPAAIESRFRGRVEYTIVLPKPNLPLYMGDWILWFAERQPATGDAPQMRAPQPSRKVEPVSGQPQIHPTGRVQMTATILKTGRVDGVSLLNGSVNPFTQAAINDLQTWWFTPAVRDGQTVDVDIVVEIPFR